MDRKGVKFARGGKGQSNGGQQDTPPSRSKQSNNLNGGLPSIVVGKASNGHTNNGGKSKTETPPTRVGNQHTLLPPIDTAESREKPAAPPSGKSSRKMSAADGPQTAEFAYSHAVESALRKYGFWSSRPVPRGYKAKYLEAEIPSLNEIYQDYVFMRRTRGESTSGPPISMDEFRPAQPISRTYVEQAPPEPSIPVRTPATGRDTPMPKRLRSGSMSRFPSLAVEIRMKKPPRTPQAKKTGGADAASSRSVSVISVSMRE